MNMLPRANSLLEPALYAWRRAAMCGDDAAVISKAYRAAAVISPGAARRTYATGAASGELAPEITAEITAAAATAGGPSRAAASAVISDGSRLSQRGAIERQLLDAQAHAARSAEEAAQARIIK